MLHTWAGKKQVQPEQGWAPSRECDLCVSEGPGSMFYVIWGQSPGTKHPGCSKGYKGLVGSHECSMSCSPGNTHPKTPQCSRTGGPTSPKSTLLSELQWGSSCQPPPFMGADGDTMCWKPTPGLRGVLARGHEAPKTPGKARRLRRSVAVLLGGGMGSTTAAKPASAGDVITVSRAPSPRQRGSGLSGRGGGSSSSCWAPAPAAQGRGERKKG